MEYTFRNLMERYGSKQPALVRLINRHLSELGSHAKKINGEWIFDDTAVQIVDRLKGFGQVVPTAEAEEKKALEDTVRNLQASLLEAQHEALEAYKANQALYKQLQETQAKLNEAQYQLRSVRQVKSENSHLKLLVDQKLKKLDNIDDGVRQISANISKYQGYPSFSPKGWNRRGGSRFIRLVEIK